MHLALRALLTCSVAVLTSLASASAGAQSTAQSTGGQSPADFYKGKTIDLIVGYAPGAGYDAYAQLLRSAFSKNMPGNPNVLIKHMPGAGSLIAVNHLYNRAPRDGTVIGLFNRAAPMEPMLANENAQFDPARLTWIGSLNNEVSICAAWHTAPVRTWDDATRHELMMIVGNITDDTGIFPTILMNMFDAKFRLITGFGDGTKMDLAFEQGEGNARCGWSWGTAKQRRGEWFTSGQAIPFVQFGLRKHPDLPNVPLVLDLARNDDEREVLKLLFARQVMGRPVAGPPDIPADRFAALRQAFADTMKDPEFIATAGKMNLEYEFVSGEEVEKIVADMSRASPAVVKMAIAATKRR